MKNQELKNLSIEELTQKESDLKKELYKLNYQRKMGRVEKPHLFKQTKRDIARIKTFIYQRQFQTALKKESNNVKTES